MKTIIAGIVALFAWQTSGLSAQLVMVEEKGCIYCKKWNDEVSHIYPKTNEGRRAPLRRVDLRDLPDDIQFSSPPVFTPTFVLVDDGIELGRLEGYAGDEFFWFLLKTLLDQFPKETSPQ